MIKIPTKECYAAITRILSGFWDILGKQFQIFDCNFQVDYKLKLNFNIKKKCTEKKIFGQNIVNAEFGGSHQVLLKKATLNIFANFTGKYLW